MKKLSVLVATAIVALGVANLDKQLSREGLYK